MKNLSTKLQRLGIGELRVLGRLVGAPSPTTMLRAELIESILALAEGKAEPTTDQAGPVKGKPPSAREPGAEIAALAEEIKTMIALNRPFRLQLDRNSRFRLSRSDSLFAGLSAPEEDRVRAGYLFRVESGTWFLFDARFLPVMTLSDRDADWRRFRPGSYLAVTVRDGETDVWGVDGTAAEEYRFPLAWQPLAGRYARTRGLPLGGREYPLGGRLLYRGEFPADELAEYLGDDLRRAALGLHFGLSEPARLDGCETCAVRSADDAEKIGFVAARAARLAERGLDVLILVTGVQDAEDFQLIREILFPLTGCGAADGTITVLAATRFPLGAEGFEAVR